MNSFFANPNHNQSTGQLQKQLQWTVTFLVVVLAISVAGCRDRFLTLDRSPLLPDAPIELSEFGDNLIENPLPLPVTDRNFAWDQLIDELEDYFKVRQEQRVSISNNVVMEGWVETYPTTGATIFEPWRKDSTPGFERLQSTFQTIRRWAKVRVIPNQGGFSYDVKVYKEIEDLDHPQHAKSSSAVERHDNSRERDDYNLPRSPGSYGWIPLGRDISLEQRILSQLKTRLTQSPDETVRGLIPLR